MIEFQCGTLVTRPAEVAVRQYFAADRTGRSAPTSKQFVDDDGVKNAPPDGF